MTAKLCSISAAAVLAACAFVCAPAGAQTDSAPDESRASATTPLPPILLIQVLLQKVASIQQPGTTTVDATVDQVAPAVGSVTNDVQGLMSSRKLTQVATGQNVGGTLTTTNIAIECAAAASTAVAVDVQACYLLGADGSVHRAPHTGAKPGAADATASGVVLVPNQAYKVCVRSQALFRDGTYLAASTACSG